MEYPFTTQTIIHKADTSNQYSSNYGTVTTNSYPSSYPNTTSVSSNIYYPTQSLVAKNLNANFSEYPTTSLQNQNYPTSTQTYPSSTQSYPNQSFVNSYPTQTTSIQNQYPIQSNSSYPGQSNSGYPSSSQISFNNQNLDSYPSNNISNSYGSYFGGYFQSNFQQGNMQNNFQQSYIQNNQQGGYTQNSNYQQGYIQNNNQQQSDIQNNQQIYPQENQQGFIQNNQQLNFPNNQNPNSNNVLNIQPMGGDSKTNNLMSPGLVKPVMMDRETYSEVIKSYAPSLESSQSRIEIKNYPTESVYKTQEYDEIPLIESQVFSSVKNTKDQLEPAKQYAPSENQVNSNGEDQMKPISLKKWTSFEFDPSKAQKTQNELLPETTMLKSNSCLNQPSGEIPKLQSLDQSYDILKKPTDDGIQKYPGFEKGDYLTDEQIAELATKKLL